MKNKYAVISIVLGTATLALAGPVRAADSHMCIMSSMIADTHVIDSKTILAHMRDKTYQRIDLLNNCSELTTPGVGFSYQTSIDRLCVQDPLKVTGPVGQICIINKIVPVDRTAAQALLARHKGD